MTQDDRLRVTLSESGCDLAGNPAQGTFQRTHTGLTGVILNDAVKHVVCNG